MPSRSRSPDRGERGAAGGLLAAGVMVWALSAGVPLAPSASAGEAAPRGLAGGCDRSVAGDTATAKRHLARRRSARALLYVRGLADCPEAQGSPEFLQVAMDVYVAAGLLNKAWMAWHRATGLLAVGQDAVRSAELGAWQEAFASRHLLVRVAAGGTPPKIEYAGPFVDDSTRKQLKAMAEGRGVRLDSGALGYWLLPGRYRVNGSVRQLRAGQVLGEDSG